MAGVAQHKTADATRPVNRIAAVTPSDVTILATTRGLYVGVSGDLSVTMADGSTGVFKSAAIGYHPLQVQMVNAATTATNILALY